MGDFDSVTTVQAKLYAGLRTNQDENLVVLINTGGMAIDDYRITVRSSALKTGSYTMESAFGPEFQLDLAVDQGGGFSLSPEIPIPAYSTLILDVRPVE